MANDLLNAAIAYAESGLSVLPLAPRSKIALLKDWPQKASSDARLVHQWWKRWPDANIGVHVGKSGLVVLDVDPRNGGDVSLELLKAKHGTNWLSHASVKTGGGGLHYVYAQSGNENLLSQLAPGIDLKHGIGYIVAPPSIHPSGETYEFVKCGLTGGEVDFLPAVPQWFSAESATPALANVEDVFSTIRIADPETPANIERVKSALDAIPANCSRDEWRDILFAITSTGWACAPTIAREWSLTAPHIFEERAFANVTKNAKAKANGITLGTLFAKAKANGWQDPLKKGIESYGDISNGRRFAARYRGRLLHVHATRVWYSWKGQRWAPCDNDEAMMAAKAIADECFTETASAVRADPTESAKRNLTQALGVHRSVRRLEAMLQTAASEPGMSIANPGLLDANPLRLGVLNGVLDLRSGELLEAQPTMLVSRQAGAPYEWQAECPMWEGFLLEAMRKDTEIVHFIQRICGYALTGLVDEEKLFFAYGTGANGKSVFANVIAAALGEYAVTVRAALLARDPRGGSSDAEREKARLPGSRIVLINETGQGDVWDDQRVKEVVSRERVSARQLYGESFDFMPTHKLFVRGNHQPGALDASDGFWRRIVLIAFVRQFEEAERISDLDRQIIEHELPGVLAWMVVGCLEWQKHGLKIPASVTAAVANYRRDTDMMGEWIESCCNRCHGAEESIGSLFMSYERWLKEANTKAPSRNVFGRQLIQRGFTKRKTNGRTLYAGLTIRSAFEGAETL